MPVPCRYPEGMPQGPRTDRVGEEFTAAVLDVDDTHAVVAIDDPAVRARCAGSGFAAGTRISARLTVADPRQRRVLFEKV